MVSKCTGQDMGTRHWRQNQIMPSWGETFFHTFSLSGAIAPLFIIPLIALPMGLWQAIVLQKSYRALQHWSALLPHPPPPAIELALAGGYIWSTQKVGLELDKPYKKVGYFLPGLDLRV